VASVDGVTARSMLIVDDDETLRQQLKRAFTQRGLEVRAAASAEAALALAREDSPELAVVDLRMPGMGGLELVRELKAIDATTRIVVLTGFGSISNAVEAVRLGALNYLTKPADADEVLEAFARHEKATSDEQGPQAPSLARAEWEHINRVLTACGGNVSEAARRLGLHRRTLQRKLQKHPPAR
jgi:two-component system response regulator RegA